MNCRVMGIVNVTPDSFSDGGRYFRPEEAIRRAENMIAEGADIVDIGGESTRPGAVPIGWEEEWKRIAPVIEGLAAHGVLLSVDTYHPETAERAIKAGAKILNCVYPEPASEMLKLCMKHSCELVLPASPDLPNLPNLLYLDPMIGFGTTREEDLRRLKSIPELAKKGRVLVGASRKRIVKKLTGEKSAVGKNIGGNVAIAVWAAMNGASVVRVHDVRETVQAMKVVGALSDEKV